MFVQIHVGRQDKRQIVLHVHVDHVVQRNEGQRVGIVVIRAVDGVVQRQDIFLVRKDKPEQTVLVLALGILLLPTASPLPL